jgi:hypothetical protein
MNKLIESIENASLDVDVMQAAEPDLITLTQASKLIRGKSGGFINLQELQRYAKRGRVLSIDGKSVRLVLPTTFRGATKFTTAAAVAAFNRKFGELATFAAAANV